MIGKLRWSSLIGTFSLVSVAAGAGLLPPSSGWATDWRAPGAQRCAVDNCNSGRGPAQNGGALWTAFGSLFRHSNGGTPPPRTGPAWRAYDLNEQAIAAENAKDYAGAERLARQALSFTPNDSIIRRNLAITLSHEGSLAADRGENAAALAYFRESLTYIPAGDPGGAIVRNAISELQERVAVDEQVKREQEDAHQKDQAAEAAMRDRIRTLTQSMSSSPDLGGGGSGGLGFVDFGGDTKVVDARTAAPGQPLPPASSDPMVVDLTGTPGLYATRAIDLKNTPSSLPKSVDEQIPHTPAGERERRGYEAIQAHQWKAALAWFQDALNHDPGNAGIQRLIDLATFTMAHENEPYRAVLDVPSPNRDDPKVKTQWNDFVHSYVPQHPEVVAETRAAAQPVLDDPDLRPLSEAGHPGPLTDEQVKRQAGELRQAAAELSRKSAENDDLGLLFNDGSPGSFRSDVAQAQADLARNFLATADAMDKCKCTPMIVFPEREDMALLTP